MLSIGTAGWSIPRAAAEQFPGEGTHLQRYSQILRCAEINSSFYRPHAHKVYARWAASTPTDFRFSVKLPRVITHEYRLAEPHAPLEKFLTEVSGLGPKLGPLLVQLPPSLEFQAPVAGEFFATLRAGHAGSVVCEPRHISWFGQAADDLLVRFRIARAAADPALDAAASRPGGWTGGADDGGSVIYFRWHGSPRMYWSIYESSQLRRWADDVKAWPASADIWCIFDNTAAGGAILNALELREYVDNAAPAGGAE